jgi:hypothetical protein
MGKVGKQTKKFQKGGLKSNLSVAIKKRKQGQKISQWKKKRATVGPGGGGEDREGHEEEQKKASVAKKSIGDMDVDEFLESGFDMDDSDAEGDAEEEEEVQRGKVLWAMF